MTTYSLIFSFLNPKAISFKWKQRVNEKLLTYVQWKYTALTWPLHLCRKRGKGNIGKSIHFRTYLCTYIDIKSQDPFSPDTLYFVIAKLNTDCFARISTVI